MDFLRPRLHSDIPHREFAVLKDFTVGPMPRWMNQMPVIVVCNQDYSRMRIIGQHSQKDARQVKSGEILGLPRSGNFARRYLELKELRGFVKGFDCSIDHIGMRLEARI